MLERVGTKDRSATVTLNVLEQAVLDHAMHAFIKGLADPDIRREATKGLASAQSSLKGLYTLADEARRTRLK